GAIFTTHGSSKLFPLPFGRWPSLPGFSSAAGDWSPLRSADYLTRPSLTSLVHSHRVDVVLHVEGKVGRLPIGRPETDGVLAVHQRRQHHGPTLRHCRGDRPGNGAVGPLPDVFRR